MISNPSIGLATQQGTYTGDGTDDRQILTGFRCGSVVVVRGAGNQAWLSCTTAANHGLKLHTVPTIEVTATDVLLHAVDGFIVDEASANDTGVTYY